MCTRNSTVCVLVKMLLINILSTTSKMHFPSLGKKCGNYFFGLGLKSINLAPFRNFGKEVR